MSESSREEKLEALNQWFEFTAGRTTPEGFRYPSIVGLIQQEGELLTAEAFTAEEESELLKLFEAVRTAGVGMLRQCYRNAAQLAITGLLGLNMNVLYGEGYGVSDVGVIPLEHAVLIYNGKPVDITWRDVYKDRRRTAKAMLMRAKTNLASNVYYMVAFSVKFTMEQMLSREHYGILEFNKDLFITGVPPVNPIP